MKPAVSAAVNEMLDSDRCRGRGVTDLPASEQKAGRRADSLAVISPVVPNEGGSNPSSATEETLSP